MYKLIAVLAVIFNFPASKYLKEGFAQLIIGKDEFKNIDVDLITRITFFLF